MVSRLFFSSLCILTILFTNAQNTIFKATQIYNYKQDDTKITDKNYLDVINTFDEFEIYEIPLEKINDYVYANIDQPDFTLQLGQKHQWELSLELHNLFATDYRKSVQKENQKRTMELKSPKPFTFRAKVNNSQTDISTLSIKRDLFIANIIQKDKEYMIKMHPLINL